jgi:AcrR family transcriptional regulator
VPPNIKYAKGLAKREEILQVALEFIARRGYHAATVRQLADAVGLSKTGLLHHFGSKEELFAEILRRRDALATDVIDPAQPDRLVEDILAAIRRNLDAPGLIDLYVRFTAEATEAGHPAHERFRDRYRRLHEFGNEAMRTLRDDGRIPAAADPDKFAELMSALIDGLQLRSRYSPELDVAGHLEHFFAVLDSASKPSPAPNS